MSIYLGSEELDPKTIGGDDIEAIYVGTDEVWTSGVQINFYTIDTNRGTIITQTLQGKPGDQLYLSFQGTADPNGGDFLLHLFAKIGANETTWTRIATPVSANYAVTDVDDGYSTYTLRYGYQESSQSPGIHFVDRYFDPITIPSNGLNLNVHFGEIVDCRQTTKTLRVGTGPITIDVHRFVLWDKNQGLLMFDCTDGRYDWSTSSLIYKHFVYNIMDVDYGRATRLIDLGLSLNTTGAITEEELAARLAARGYYPYGYDIINDPVPPYNSGCSYAADTTNTQWALSGGYVIPEFEQIKTFNDLCFKIDNPSNPTPIDQATYKCFYALGLLYMDISGIKIQIRDIIHNCSIYDERPLTYSCYSLKGNLTQSNQGPLLRLSYYNMTPVSVDLVNGYDPTTYVSYAPVRLFRSDSYSGDILINS